MEYCVTSVRSSATLTGNSQITFTGNGCSWPNEEGSKSHLLKPLASSQNTEAGRVVRSYAEPHALG